MVRNRTIKKINLGVGEMSQGLEAFVVAIWSPVPRKGQVGWCAPVAPALGREGRLLTGKPIQTTVSSRFSIPKENRMHND